MPKGAEQVREPLDFDRLLAPIPGDEPAGPPSVYIELRPQFEEMRREVTPERAAQLKEDAKDPDWLGQERKTQEALAETTKDLRITGYLLEALVKNHGFAGARDGLKLLRLMVEQCWDRLNPPVDPEDPEVRAGPFYWLDAERGLRFPTTLRLAPLLFGPERAYSLEECRPTEEDPAKQPEEVKALRAEAHRAAETAPADKLTLRLRGGRRLSGGAGRVDERPDGQDSARRRRPLTTSALPWRSARSSWNKFSRSVRTPRQKRIPKRRAVRRRPRPAAPGRRRGPRGRRSTAASNRPPWPSRTWNRIVRSRISCYGRSSSVPCRSRSS